MFEPVRTRRTFEEAVAQIAEVVQAGDLQVGDRLPSERDLAVQMQISRPTVREAVKVLSDSGVIEVRPGPGGGMFVKSEVVPLGLLNQRSQMRISEVSAVLEARRLLEPRVAQLAALYGAEDDFDALQETIDRQRHAAGDHNRALKLDCPVPPPDGACDQESHRRQNDAHAAQTTRDRSGHDTALYARGAQPRGRDS